MPKSGWLEWEVTGLKELEKELKELGVKAGNEIVRAAMKEAASATIDKIVENAPKNTGWMSGHFIAKFKMARDFVGGTMLIGPSNAEYPEKKKGG